MGKRVAAGDRQPESGPTGRASPVRIEPHQPLEDPLPIGPRYAGTGVEDIDVRPSLVCGQGHRDPAPRPCGPGGVVEQVPQHAADPIRVAPDHDIGAAHRHVDVRTEQPRAVGLGRGESAERCRHRLELKPRVEPRRGKQIRDQGARPARLADQQHLELLPLRAIE